MNLSFYRLASKVVFLLLCAHWISAECEVKYLFSNYYRPGYCLPILLSNLDESEAKNKTLSIKTTSGMSFVFAERTKFNEEVFYFPATENNISFSVKLGAESIREEKKVLQKLQATDILAGVLHTSNAREAIVSYLPKCACVSLPWLPEEWEGLLPLNILILDSPITFSHSSAVRAWVRAGGILVIAHPFLLKDEELQKTLHEKFFSDGIEIFRYGQGYSCYAENIHQKEFWKKILEIAQKQKRFLTVEIAFPNYPFSHSWQKSKSSPILWVVLFHLATVVVIFLVMRQRKKKFVVATLLTFLTLLAIHFYFTSFLRVSYHKMILTAAMPKNSTVLETHIHHFYSLGQENFSQEFTRVPFLISSSATLSKKKNGWELRQNLSQDKKLICKTWDCKEWVGEISIRNDSEDFMTVENKTEFILQDIIYVDSAGILPGGNCIAGEKKVVARENKLPKFFVQGLPENWHNFSPCLNWSRLRRGFYAFLPQKTNQENNFANYQEFSILWIMEN